MSDLEKEADECFAKQIDPEESEFECFFHYTDEKLFAAGFKKGYELAIQQANGVTTGEKQCNLPVVNNLAKLAEFVKQQKDLPPKINDIVNDNFWDLI